MSHQRIDARPAGHHALLLTASVSSQSMLMKCTGMRGSLCDSVLAATHRLRARRCLLEVRKASRLVQKQVVARQSAGNAPAEAEVAAGRQRDGLQRKSIRQKSARVWQTSLVPQLHPSQIIVGRHRRVFRRCGSWM